MHVYERGMEIGSHPVLLFSDWPFNISFNFSFIVKVEELMIASTYFEAIFRDLRHEKLNMWNQKWPVLRNNKYPLLAGSMIFPGFIALFVR